MSSVETSRQADWKNEFAHRSLLLPICTADPTTEPGSLGALRSKYPFYPGRNSTLRLVPHVRFVFISSRRFCLVSLCLPPTDWSTDWNEAIIVRGWFTLDRHALPYASSSEIVLIEESHGSLLTDGRGFRSGGLSLYQQILGHCA